MNYGSHLFWIRLKLGQWGSKCRAFGIGYPTMAATEKARIGRGGSFNGPSLPVDLEEIDNAVCLAPVDYKAILVECYTKQATPYEHAVRLGLKKDAYYRRKNSAEQHIYEILNSRNAQVPLGLKVAM